MSGKWRSASQVVVTANSSHHHSPKSPAPVLTRRPSLEKQKSGSSWQIKGNQTPTDVDWDDQVSVQILDYSPLDLKESRGFVDHNAFSFQDEPLLGSSRPEWASVRWTNMDCILDHPGQVRAAHNPNRTKPRPPITRTAPNPVH
jgi:hypothetical protein